RSSFSTDWSQTRSSTACINLSCGIAEKQLAMSVSATHRRIHGQADLLLGRDVPQQLAARARCVPQLLWPGWAVRLMPAEGLAAVPFRSAIATCLLLPGKPPRALPPGDRPH